MTTDEKQSRPKIEITLSGHEITSGHGTLKPSVSAPLTGEAIKVEQGNLGTTLEYWRKHPTLIVIVILLSFGPPFLSLIYSGWAGVIAGLIPAAVCFWVGPRAQIRMREITRNLR